MKPAVKTKRRGGRPSKEAAHQIEDNILDAAAALFLNEGYGAVSIEQIARRAQISKRTFYARFENKEAIFRAVVQRIIDRMRPPPNATDKLFVGENVEEVLRRIAPVILRATVSSEALALHRIIVAESQRFPELALIMNQQGSRQEAIRRVAELLQHAAVRDKKTLPDAIFAAEQFLLMVTAVPQRRMLGLGNVMTPAELDRWASATVDLFLRGCWG